MNPIEQGIKFIITNSLVGDNMIVLTPSEISAVQISSTLRYSPATIDECKDYSLPECEFQGTVTIEDYDAHVLIFSKHV